MLFYGVIPFGGSNNTRVDLSNVKAISMGYHAGAALKEDGTVVLWGHTDYGGSNNTGVDLTNVKEISMGGHAGAALKEDGSVVLMGFTNLWWFKFRK